MSFLTFLAGLYFGCAAGILLMCLVQANRTDDNEKWPWK